MNINSVNPLSPSYASSIGQMKYQQMLNLYTYCQQTYGLFIRDPRARITQDGYVILPQSTSQRLLEMKFKDGVAYFKLKDRVKNIEYDLVINPPDLKRLNSMVISEALKDLGTGKIKSYVVYELFPNGSLSIVSKG